MTSLNSDIKKVIAMMSGQLSALNCSAYCSDWDGCTSDCTCTCLEDSVVYGRRIGEEVGTCSSTSDCWSCAGYQGDSVGEGSGDIKKIGTSWHGKFTCTFCRQRRKKEEGRRKKEACLPACLPACRLCHLLWCRVVVL